jgi:putative polyhydroxyalkanoate system protein
VPDLRIEREHELGLPAARQVAARWVQAAQERFDMACEHEEGESSDRIRFSRSGVSGELNVTAQRFVLDAKLGFLLGAFKDRIEGEIAKNLDELLAPPEAKA